MKTYIAVAIGITIALSFLYIIYRFLPLGLAIVITGGCLATLTRERQDKFTYYIGLLGSWLYPIGIIYSFIAHGWVIGLVSIVVGFTAYQYAKG